jgi:hypothetical protein
MGAKTTGSGQYANNLLALIFNATTYTGLAQNAGSPYVNLYVSLHTASPTATGNQTSFEARYQSYARVSITRTSAGWTVTANSVSPAATISFPTSGVTSTDTETYFGVGTSSVAAGNLLYFGTISPNIAVTGSGITPQLTTGSAITES